MDVRMNVIVVDGANLADEVDFPELYLDKFGWQQYPELEGEKLAGRCWRSGVIIVLDTPIGQAAKERGITVCNLLGGRPQ